MSFTASVMVITGASDGIAAARLRLRSSDKAQLVLAARRAATLRVF